MSAPTLEAIIDVQAKGTREDLEKVLKQLDKLSFDYHYKHALSGMYAAQAGSILIHNLGVPEQTLAPAVNSPSDMEIPYSELAFIVSEAGAGYDGVNDDGTGAGWMVFSLTGAVVALLEKAAEAAGN